MKEKEGLRRKAQTQASVQNMTIVIQKHIRLSPFEEAILHAKPSDKPEPDHSRTAWPKQEATILAELQENPASPAVVTRMKVSELRTWTFYGEEANE